MEAGPCWGRQRVDVLENMWNLKECFDFINCNQRFASALVLSGWENFRMRTATRDAQNPHPCM